jgi:pyrroloquinoline quinone biosynthesis protein B
MQDFPVRRMLQSYASFRWVEVKTNREFVLDEDRLQVSAFPLGGKRPRYTGDSGVNGEWVLGYRFKDRQTRSLVVYAPAIERWSAALAAHAEGADCVFVDGTFWDEREIEKVAVGRLNAKTNGHLPISGCEGSAEHLRSVRARRKIYVHINNTNPVLEEKSPERRLLAESGIEVGWDGMELEI